MLIRSDDRGWLLVTQPMHADVSGQLARAWGNEEFGELSPRHGVELGALLHDIGWVGWEQQPTFNPETGLPHTFLELPLATHLHMWGAAAPSALVFGRYPALLTSMHGTNLYGSRDLTKMTTADASAIRAFLDSQAALQDRLLTSLREDPDSAATALPDNMSRNQRLIATWDAMSLALCGTQRGQREFNHVTTANGECVMTLTPQDNGVIVSPWPFADDMVSLTFEGRRITERSDTESQFAQKLATARWETVTVTLQPPPNLRG
jgi:hypothetical protein